AYPNAAAFGLPNDSVSSVLVGPGAQAILCVDDNYGGDCQRFTASDPHLGSDRIGNDRVSSVKVQRAGEFDCNPGPNQGAFSVYDHINFLSPCSGKAAGEYAMANDIGVGDNSISSIRVGGSVQACVCDGPNFTVECRAYTADVATLGDHWNDKISSMKVGSRG